MFAICALRLDDMGKEVLNEPKDIAMGPQTIRTLVQISTAGLFPRPKFNTFESPSNKALTLIQAERNILWH